MGGVLAAVDWRLVFLVNVPIGVAGIVWSFWQLREVGERHPARIDWLGNLTFAAGLAVLLTGITYGIKPYGASNMGWSNPFVIVMIATGIALLVAFFFIERYVAEPMFNLGLFRIRAFRRREPRGGALVHRQRRHAVHAHHVAPGHLAAAPRLQLRADAAVGGIYMLPLTMGFLVAGPISGHPVRPLRSGAPSRPPACCSRRSASCC